MITNMVTTINEFKFLQNLFKKKEKRYTPDPIDPATMGSNDIFVFGSNTEGKHGGGAARVAVNYYGAIYGQARGLQGNSYAIITLDYTGKEPITTREIGIEIDNFLSFAKQHPKLTFWTTKIGCGISGYAIADIAPLFKGKKIPSNVILPIEFT